MPAKAATMDFVAHYGIGIGALAMGAASAFDRRIAAHRRRTDQLGVAAAALKEHYDALEGFADDPGAPSILSEFLLDFSDSIDDKTVAIEVASQAGGYEAPRPPGSRYAKILSGVDRLRDHRADLVELFDTAISAGITAAFLRWDETAAMYQDTVAPLAGTSGRQFRLAVSFVGCAQRRRAGRAGFATRMAAA
jgi:hypothetical protein